MYLDLTDLSDPHIREQVRRADLIFGHDVHDGGAVLLFGRAAFRRIVADRKGRWLRRVRVNFDSRTAELAALCAVVKAIKGHCEYDDDFDLN